MIDDLLDRDPAPGTPEADRLQFLSVLVADYDDRHFPMPAPTSPQAVVAFMLEQHGMERAELAPLMGGRSRVSDFFAGKRSLSVNQILALKSRLGTPADLLLEAMVEVAHARRAKATRAAARQAGKRSAARKPAKPTRAARSTGKSAR